MQPVAAVAPHAAEATEPTPQPRAAEHEGAARSGLAEEVKLLAAVRRELRRGDAQAALGKLALHARRFEDGALTEEREGLTVLALCRLNRMEQARARRERFLARAPSSVLAAKVRRACAEAAP